MAIKFNIEPYWDDFETAGSDGLSPKEKYHKILFRPSHAIQARELTQLQSMLQNQVSALGAHNFKEGSMVVPGAVHAHNKIVYLKVTTSVTTLTDFVGKEITDGTTIGKVIHVEAATGSDPVTLFINYVSGSTFSSTASLTGTGLAATVTATGYGSLVSVEEGIYYIKKHFVVVKSSTIVLDKYTHDVSYDVGLTVLETLVDSDTDASLVDNAQGTPNETATGAHRYAITTDLVKQAVNSATGDFVLLARLDSGVVVKEINHSTYAILGDTLARRTFDESGNYTVNPFPVDIKNHVGADATKLTLGIEPSKAYVRGYEIETLSTTNVDLNRSRNSALGTDKVVEVTNTSWIDITGMTSLPDITTFGVITLKTSGSVATGTCRVRSIQSKGSGAYRLHIFDLTGTITGAAKLDSSTSFAATGITAFDVTNESLVFPLPYNRVKTCNSVTDPNIAADFNYRFEANRSISGVVAGTLAIFSGQNLNETFASFDSTNWILIKDTTGAIQTVVSGDVVVDNVSVPPKVTINNLSVTGNMTLIAKVTRTLTHKTKVKTNATKVVAVSVSLNAKEYQDLGHSDVIGLTTVTEGGVDITRHFEFDTGQTPSHYGLGRVRLKPDTNYTVAANIDVAYEYLTHTSGDFFTVDSYTGQVDYEDIGKFDGVELRSAVDFRPRKADGLANFTGSNASVNISPLPNTQFETDIQYYLNRIDKVYIDKNGEFGVLEGVSALDPSIPGTPKDSMVLYELYVPAYTMTAAEVEVTFIDNQRYTMRDIGKLEKRINNLEYYTTLSLLETDTSQLQILDGSGNSRWKSGFLVDSFTSTKVGRVDSTEYRAGIERATGTLRPLFTEGNVGLDYKAGASTTQRTGDIVTLPYTSSAIITQTQSSGSINVNPYDVFNWGGTVKLTPSSDEWKDIDRRPQVVINQDGVWDAMSAIVNETVATGTVWGSWKTTWAGATREVNAGGRRRDTKRDIKETRAGVITTIGSSTVTNNVGDRVVEVSFAPFMRSRVVGFSATRMKPNTRVYAFFDDIDVSTWVSTNSAAGIVPSIGVNGITTHPATATILTTDAAGAIVGSFFVPNNTTLNFKTGDKTFKLTDSATNSASDNGTFATAMYSAKGLIETKENVSISTRVPTIDRKATDQNNSRTETLSTRWVDPLAQSIQLNLNGGAFVTSLELYFTTKDSSLPVQVQLREMENGIPTPRIVPFSDKTINSGSVNIDGTSTVFTFDSPVYLQDGVEYCFVIMANSSDYRVKYAEIGGEDETGNRISKQPYNGVMFKSQNASTWTPDQNKDITFKMNRAVFDITSNINVVLENQELPTRSLAMDALATTNASTAVVVEHRNHGMTAGESVTISTAITSDLNGIVAANINKSHTISAVERDRYTITAATAATSTGVDGGMSITATQNLSWDSLYPLVQEVTLPNTSMTWGIKDRTYIGNNNYAAYPSVDSPIIINSDYEPIAPKAVLSGGTPSLQLTGSFASSKDNVSPFIDMERCSVITISNRIDTPSVSTVADYYAETDASRGSALAKYVTKTVSLTETADALKVYMDINRPSFTDVKLYHKVGSVAGTFDAQPWVEITAVVPFSDDDVYKEVIFDFDSTADPFTMFAIKVVMTSTSTSSVPSVKKFRAVALT
jgi:hypothetical protein